MALIEAIWGYPANGFKWLEREDGVHWLVPAEKTDTIRDYRPMDHSGLFRTFAEITPTKEGILKFANQYGWLGIDPRIQIDASDMSAVRYEELNQWIDSIALMHLMVDLWCNLDNREYLWEHIEWKGYDSVFFTPSIETRLPESFRLPSNGLIADDQHTVDFGKIFRPGDVLEPARHWLKRVINKHLYGEVSIAMRNDLNIMMVPKNLIGALWLQFAQAVAGRKLDWQQCLHCGKYFEIAPGIGRKDKKYCSSACRVAASRERKKGGKS